jgi:hypothetical protein
MPSAFTNESVYYSLGVLPLWPCEDVPGHKIEAGAPKSFFMF